MTQRGERNLEVHEPYGRKRRGKHFFPSGRDVIGRFCIVIEI